MLSYRFMRMSMEGNRTGTESVTPEQVLLAYPVTPLRMPMNMHMFGIMIAPSDRVTLMGMLPIVSLEMDHRTQMGGEFTTEASGIGDLALTTLLEVHNANRLAFHPNLGVRAPAGSIDEMDVTPASAPNEAILPYPMQLGSGTWDLVGGGTYLGQSDRASWGARRWERSGWRITSAAIGLGTRAWVRSGPRCASTTGSAPLRAQPCMRGATWMEPTPP
jgi:hypothetical protein